MSFHYVPGQFRIPKTPLFAMPDGIWCGADADSGVFAFEAGYSWGGRIMSRELCFSLSIDGSVMKPVFSSINLKIAVEVNSASARQPKLAG